jgi:hypothetical protein
VVPDNHLPKSVTTGVTKALFQDGEITDYVLEEIVAGVGVKAERMYAYGRDTYTYGLPSGQFLTAAEDIYTAVTTVLVSIENASVQLDYLRHGPVNSIHIGWMALMASHGYDPSTNVLGVLTAAKGTPVYLNDMVLVVPSSILDSLEPQSLEQWGIAARAGVTPERQEGTAATRAMVTPTDIEKSLIATQEFLRVEYVWVSATGVQKDVFTIPVTGYDNRAEYFQARYTVGTTSKYWIYRSNAGTYSTLDRMFDHTPVSGGTFFPFAYFRFEKHSEIADKTTQSYKTSKKLVSYLGIDYDKLAASIDSNPGITDVEQAILMMAVPANTTNMLEQRYLWEFFNQLFLSSSTAFQYRSEQAAYRKEALVDTLDRQQAGLQSPGIVIQDQRFKMTLDNAGIYKKRVAGSIGATGTYSSELSAGSHYYRRQISPGFYDEIQVVGMRSMFHILGEYSTIAQDDQTYLIVPIDKSITHSFSVPDRETLYTRSLQLVFNSLVVTQVKWYETGLFKVVLIVVAIVAMVLSYGQVGYQVAGLIAAGSYAAAATIVLTLIVEALIIRAVFKLFVKAVGIKLAFIVAVIAACVGIADLASDGSLVGTPFAQNLLTVSSGLTTAVSYQTKEDFQDLLKEASLFQTSSKKELDALDAAKKLLDNQSVLSPLVIFGEKPDAYYNRTVHSGNIGIVGINAVSSFVDRALTLPTLNDTLRRNEYASF